jgi:hypothetical protein
MSSPRRATKTVAKTTTKAAPKPVSRAAVARPAPKSNGAVAKPRVVAAKPNVVAAKPSVAVANGASAEAKALVKVLERGIVDGQLDVVSTDALQALMAAACRVYTARVEAGEKFNPIAKNSISATDVMVTASGLLKAVDLAVFELGMWQSWTGR